MLLLLILVMAAAAAYLVYHHTDLTGPDPDPATEPIESMPALTRPAGRCTCGRTRPHPGRWSDICDPGADQ